MIMSTAIAPRDASYRRAEGGQSQGGDEDSVTEMRIGLRRAFFASLLVAAAVSIPLSVAIVLVSWSGLGALLVSFDLSVLAVWASCAVWMSRLRVQEMVQLSSRFAANRVSAPGQQTPRATIS